MPIFEYRCGNCSEEFEKIVLGEEKKIECPKCGSEKTQKLLSGFAVHAATASHPIQPGPCDECGAAQRGMCQAAQLSQD